MWRVLIPLAISVAFSMNSLIVGNSRDRSFVLLLWGVLGPLVGAAIWAERHPQHQWGRLLLRAWGPRTDVSNLTKVEAYRTAWTFLRYGIIGLALLMAMGYLVFINQSSLAQLAWPIILPFIVLPAGMGIIGGTYLLARALLKR